MTSNTLRVLHGWLELTEAEKQEFAREMRKYQDASYSQKSATRKYIGEQRMELGPLSGGCPCCGK